MTLSAITPRLPHPSRLHLARPQHPSRWAALALIVAAQFMVVLDVSIVNVALATIKGDLGFSEAALQWVITAYAIVFGGFLLLGGRLADLLGRRRIFIAGIALFTLGSALSGLSWSAASLVVFRGVQGLGGAMFAPAGLSLLMSAFPDGRERNTALGIWGAASGAGGAVGVLLGGVLTSYLSWPWIFYINVPVGLALVLLIPRYLPESRGLTTHRHFDVAGALSVTSSLMVLVYALTSATQHGWGSASTIGLLAAAAVLAAAFVVIERRAESPLLPFEVFRGTTLGVAALITVIVASLAFSQFFLLTLYLQQVLHYSAARTGVAFVAIAATVALVSNIAQRLVTVLGPRRVLAAGLLISAIAEGLLTRLPVHGHYLTNLLPEFLLTGTGMGLSFVAVTIAALAGVPARDAGIASGLVNTARQIGGAVGLAAVTTIATIFATHRSATESVAAGTTHGYRIAFAVLAVLAITGALLTAAMRVRHPEHSDRAEAVEGALAEAA
jgi:EmrB/QacA subfamily drug resistance transporter